MLQYPGTPVPVGVTNMETVIFAGTGQNGPIPGKFILPRSFFNLAVFQFVDMSPTLLI